MEISEYNNGGPTTAVLSFGPSITASQITVTKDSANLFLSDGTAGDLIRLDNELSSTTYGVNQVTFSDGTTWTRQQLINLATATTSANIIGTGGADRIDGKGAGFYAQGNGGADTFVYNAGYGAFEISENNNAYATTAVLRLGFNAGRVSASVDTSNNLYVTDGVPGDQVKLDGMLASTAYGVNQVTFADGTSWTRQQLINLAAWGTAGNDTIAGSSANDIFDGRGGNDTIAGGGGTDVYMFRPGYGHLTIQNASSATMPAGQLSLGLGLTNQQLWFMQTGNDLLWTLSERRIR